MGNNSLARLHSNLHESTPFWRARVYVDYLVTVDFPNQSIIAHHFSFQLRRCCATAVPCIITRFRLSSTGTFIRLRCHIWAIGGCRRDHFSSLRFRVPFEFHFSPLSCTFSVGIEPLSMAKCTISFFWFISCSIRQRISPYICFVSVFVFVCVCLWWCVCLCVPLLFVDDIMSLSRF